MKKVVVFVFLIGIFFACKKKTGETNVMGYVYSYNGKYPLGGIKSYIQSSPSNYDYTNSEGYFEIKDAPSGDQVLVLESGSFKTTINVKIKKGEDNVVSTKNNPIKFGKETISPVKMAVVYGDYDQIEGLLDSIGFPKISSPDVDSTGYVFYSYYTDILYNPQELSKFDILFLNCSSYEDFRQDNIAINNLKNYINSGGSLYASDWAYDAIEATFPEYIDFYGEDTIPGDAKEGESEENVSSRVSDERIKEALGKEKIFINFNLGEWVIIDNVGNQTEVWVKADSIHTYTGALFNKPLMVKFNYGSGKVIYTSFHNEAQITQDMIKILITVIYSL
ncbi:MAG: hypothetical protein ABIM29_05225 [candidate division WOR-3 bacterium]